MPIENTAVTNKPPGGFEDDRKSENAIGAEHVEASEARQSSSSSTSPLGPEKQLGFLECVRTYRYASILCVCAAVGALSDGYQVQMSGSIVALPGFVRTFGVPDAETGEYAIDAQHLALWGCKLKPSQPINQSTNLSARQPAPTGESLVWSVLI